ncbi:MAG: glycosidase [Lachnospiraceae bacterium]|nr:glycosidase [Lachnospiraceae bacterium]
MSSYVDNGPMLNAYPDSIGGKLCDVTAFLQRPECKDAFGSFYILPSVFHTDLDRGFSVIDYGLNRMLADPKDFEALKDLGIDLKLDFILNHASVLSPQFQDLLKNGANSEYCDFFINWNSFWKGCGEMTKEGYIQPEEKYLQKMFFRKSGLPILMVRMPDGSDVPYWNTFYQEVQYLRPDAQDLMHGMEGDLQYQEAQALSEIICKALDAGQKPGEIDFGELSAYRVQAVAFLEAHRKYLGQMDLNIKSPKVWEHYKETLEKLSSYGAKIVRLDAFAYAPKEVGERNFMNEPGTWELLEKVRKLADDVGVTLLPEIHASYGEKVYETVAKKGYMTYDFFLPGLLLYTLEKHDATLLSAWANELQEKKIRVVNMLGCHDGIPLLDLKGLLPEAQIEELIDLLVSRGGLIKNLHGKKNMYYQVNATYFSALGEDVQKMLLARAIQMFMPGKPQIWYLDLFGGKNDYEAVAHAGEAGHKEINRTNISPAQIDTLLTSPLVTEQLRLLQLRNTHPAFGFDHEMEMRAEGATLSITWRGNGSQITLDADLSTYVYTIHE